MRTTSAAQSADASVLRRNFVWTLAGNIVYAAAQWGALVVLVKLGSPALVGRYSLALAITAPIALFFNLQLRAAQATDTRGDYLLGDYVGLRLVTVATAFAVSVAVGAAAGPSAVALVVAAVALAKGFENVSDVLYGMLQKNERMDLIAKSQMLRGGLLVAAMATVMALTHSLPLAAVTVAAGWLMLTLRYDGPNAALLAMASKPARHPLAPRWDRERMLHLARLTFPLGIGSILASLYATVPRYFVRGFGGEAALGYFSALVYFPMAGRTIVEALGQSALPRLARERVVRPDAYRRLLVTLALLVVGVGAVGAIVAALAGRQILSVVYRPDYARRLDVFVLLMIGGGVEYVASIMGIGLIAARRFRALLVALGAGVVAEVVAAAALTPRYVDRGAAWALIIGSTVWAGTASVLVSRGLPPRATELREPSPVVTEFGEIQ